MVVTHYTKCNNCGKYYESGIIHDMDPNPITGGMGGWSETTVFKCPHCGLDWREQNNALVERIGDKWKPEKNQKSTIWDSLLDKIANTASHKDKYRIIEKDAVYDLDGGLLGFDVTTLNTETGVRIYGFRKARSVKK